MKKYINPYVNLSHTVPIPIHSIGLLPITNNILYSHLRSKKKKKERKPPGILWLLSLVRINENREIK